MSDVIITCLMGDQSVIETLSGTDGILAGMRPEAIHIGTGTISPNATARIAALHTQQGSHYVAAPVLGRPDAAASGYLPLPTAAEDGSKPIQYGLIAEEVAEVYPDLVAHSADGQIESVKYQLLDAMLLNEVQRQQMEIRDLGEQIRALLDRLAHTEAH